MDKVVLKLRVGEQLRRLNLATRPVEIREVHEAISRLFPDIKSYSLFYVDEEGDRILVDQDVELQEALELARRSAQGNTTVLRLDLQPSGNEKKENTYSVPIRTESATQETPTQTPPRSANPQANSESSPNMMSSYVPKDLLFHPFMKRAAQMSQELLSASGHLASNPFVGQFLCTWGCENQIATWKELFSAVAEGRDTVVPEEMRRDQYFEERCLWIQQNKDDLKKKFDRMEVGLKKLQDNNYPYPLYLQMIFLWGADGDADQLLKGFAGIPGCNFNFNQGQGNSPFQFSSSGCGPCGGASFGSSCGGFGFPNFSASTFGPFTSTFGPSTTSYGPFGTHSYSSSCSGQPNFTNCHSPPTCHTNSTSSPNSFSFSFGEGPVSGSGSCSFSSSHSSSFSSSSDVNVEAMSVSDLKAFLRRRGVNFSGIVDKDDLKRLAYEQIGTSPCGSPSAEPNQEFVHRAVCDECKAPIKGI